MNKKQSQVVLCLAAFSTGLFLVGVIFSLISRQLILALYDLTVISILTASSLHIVRVQQQLARKKQIPAQRTDKAYLEAMAELDEVTERSGLNFMFSFGRPTNGLPPREKIVDEIVTHVPVRVGEYIHYHNGKYEALYVYLDDQVEKVVEGWIKGVWCRCLYVVVGMHDYKREGQHYWLENIVEPKKPSALEEKRSSDTIDEMVKELNTNVAASYGVPPVVSNPKLTPESINHLQEKLKEIAESSRLYQ